MSNEIEAESIQSEHHLSDDSDRDSYCDDILEDELDENEDDDEKEDNGVFEMQTDGEQLTLAVASCVEKQAVSAPGPMGVYFFLELLKH